LRSTQPERQQFVTLATGEDDVNCYFIVVIRVVYNASRCCLVLAPLKQTATAYVALIQHRIFDTKHI